MQFSFSVYLRSTIWMGTSRCQLRHLQKFRAAVPNKKLFDLSANVDKRKRTETQHSVLPCLTTSSQLWFLLYLVGHGESYTQLASESKPGHITIWFFVWFNTHTHIYIYINTFQNLSNNWTSPFHHQVREKKAPHGRRGAIGCTWVSLQSGDGSSSKGGYLPK